MWLIPLLKKKNINDKGILYTDSSWNVYLENSGFSSSLMLVNLGSSLIFIGLYFALLIFYWLLKAIGFYCPR